MIASEIRHQSYESSKDPSDVAIHNFHVDLESSRSTEGKPLFFLQDSAECKAQEEKLRIMKEDLRADRTLLLEQNAPLNLYHHHIDDIIESMGWSQPLCKPLRPFEPLQSISARAESPILENKNYNDYEDIPPKVNGDEQKTSLRDANGIFDDDNEDTLSKLDYDDEETPTLDYNKSYALPPDYQIHRHDVLVDYRESPGYRRFRVVVAMRIERYLNGEDVFPEMLDAVRQARGSFVKQIRPETVDEEERDGTPRDKNVKYIDIGNDKARELALHELLESLMGVMTEPTEDLKMSAASEVDVPLPKEPQVPESPPKDVQVEGSLSDEINVNVSLPEEPRVVVTLPKEFLRAIPTHLNNWRSVPRVDATGEPFPLPDDYQVKPDDVMVGSSNVRYPGNIRFKSFARKRAERYRAAVTRFDKRNIIDEIVLLVRSTGAHFVRHEDGVYEDIGDHKARERTIYELKNAVKRWEAQHSDKVESIKTKAALKRKENDIYENKSDYTAPEIEIPTRRVTFLDSEISETGDPSDVLKAIQQLTSLKRPRTEEVNASSAPISIANEHNLGSSPPLDNDEEDPVLCEHVKEVLPVRCENSPFGPKRSRKGLPYHVIEALSKRTRKPTSGRSYKKMKINLGPSKEDSGGIDTEYTAEIVVSI